MISIDLTGRTALVTGASRGIGKAVAVGLAKAGADIIGVSRSGPGPEVRSAIESMGRRFESHSVDFLDRRALERFSSRIATDRTIDILVNNAGTLRRSPVVDHSSESWDEVIEANLTAQFVLSRHVGSSMLTREAGKIVFIASILSFQGGMNIPSYTASKSGLIGLVRAMANEWAKEGINVNAVAPGYIATELTENVRSDASRKSQVDQRIPAGRWGTPDDVVGSVLFLVSDLARYLHGSIVTVDGGWLSR